MFVVDTSAVMNFFWDIHKSTWGPMLLISSQKGLVHTSLPTQNAKEKLDTFMIKTDGILTHREDSIIKKTKIQLDQYFSQKRKNFFIPLDLQGTDFQKKVWDMLRLIPFGKTCTYQDIATKIGNPKSCRAVGMANHHNPIPLIIPCHRVIPKGHGLGGFAGGIDLKEKILSHEEKVALHLRLGTSELTGYSASYFSTKSNL